MVYPHQLRLFWIMKQEGVWDRPGHELWRHGGPDRRCHLPYTQTARALLEGFRILDIHKAHIFTWDIDAYTRYEYQKAPEWAGVDDAELARLERELGWHLLVRAVPD